ncbi:MAG: response regulator [Desulfobacteraceae bacterium]|nr:response regulator [Desulfobacteraceae bacterium]
MSAQPVKISQYVPKILVIDDEKRIRNACRIVLEENGYNVLLATNGRQGLEQINANHFDIILLDLMMPALSGFEVLTAIKKKHPDTVVIIITGYATLEYSVEAMKQGAFDFIPKPFTPDHLRVTVAKAIEHTRTLRDISDAHSRIRTMVNSLTDGVMCTNHQNHVVLANPTFLRMNGYITKSVVGCHIKDFLKFPKLREMIHQALQMDGRTYSELSTEIDLASYSADDHRVLNARCLPFKDREGKNIGVITVLNDITALKQMDRMKSDFVSTVSHEIQGPMTAVMMQLKVILDGLAGEVTAKQKKMLSRALDKISSLSGMASELLDLARIESGLISQERERLDLGQIVKEQVALHLPKAQEANHELIVRLEDDLPPILAHRRNIEEVLSNLIINAIKYTPGQGRIRIVAERSEAYLLMCVEDNGMGIQEDQRKQVFKRFYRVKNKQTRFIHGTGLGLAIVKSIVESHQGHITLQSEPGKGAVFSVFLPIFPIDEKKIELNR